jgi:carbohydrate kinase (thermoresistant glucokinase family)
MGVSGCGKSTIGALLAQRMQITFVEGDSLHTASNIAKMGRGKPLTDEDRSPWLMRIADCLRVHHARDCDLVIACSALKRSYRDIIRSSSTEPLFIHLHGSPDAIRERLQQRRGHFMSAGMLESQLEILEPPSPDEEAITFDISLPPNEIEEQIFSALNLGKQTPC